MSAVPEPLLLAWHQPCHAVSVRGEEHVSYGNLWHGYGGAGGLAQGARLVVRGSDAHVYPPMSEKLREWGITPLEGYDADHLLPRPDTVVVGNVIRRENVEAVRARELGLPMVSMPQAVAEWGIGDRHSIVIAGTHGKTTTTALAAHLLLHGGSDPSFLVGGALVNYPESFRVGHGPYFVIEGDEYDTAYFDKGPKFLHYRPKTAVITSLEFDHADIFASIDDVESAFAKLIALVPSDGHLVVWHGATRARALLTQHAKTQHISLFATRPEPDADVYLDHYTSSPAGLTFTPVVDGRSLGSMHVAMWGDHGAANVLAALCAVRDAKLSDTALREGFASFAGVRRRMEVRDVIGGVTVVDDFAHHPTAVQKTLEAARTRWPTSRLIAIFEPRSATSRPKCFSSRIRPGFCLRRPSLYRQPCTPARNRRRPSI